MKIFESNCTFNYSWEDVSRANWRKYCAWNTQSTHVIAVDTLSRHVDANGILVTERLITCKQAAPKWLRSVFGSEESYVREVSYVDPKEKTVTMKSMNLTLNNLLSVQETVVYSPDPLNPTEKTLFRQDAQITAYGAFTRICNAIEDFSVERFGQNAQKGREGFEAVLAMSQKAFRELREGGVKQEQ